jgi:L-lactate dehydrogenase
MPIPDTARVAIIGAGHVGSTCAYALLLSGLAAEIVVIDSDRSRAEGEVMDLRHAEPFAHPTAFRTGDIEDCAGAAVVVLAAGAGQRPGETRLDLAQKNARIFRDIVPRVVRSNRDGILLIATNPVDVLTHLSLKLSGLPPERVIGSGTILDTARFRHLLSQYYGVDPRSVHAYIIGEHGDSEVPVWSLANIAGMHLQDFCVAQGRVYDQQAMDTIFAETRDAAYEIIRRKGATYYAVAAGLMRIVEAILRNQRTVLSVSTLVSNYYGLDDVCFSLPTIIARSGVVNKLRLDLSEAEVAELRRSAEVLRETSSRINN